MPNLVTRSCPETLLLYAGGLPFVGPLIGNVNAYKFVNLLDNGARQDGLSLESFYHIEKSMHVMIIANIVSLIFTAVYLAYYSANNNSVLNTGFFWMTTFFIAIIEDGGNTLKLACLSDRQIKLLCRRTKWHEFCIMLLHFTLYTSPVSIFYHFMVKRPLFRMAKNSLYSINHFTQDLSIGTPKTRYLKLLNKESTAALIIGVIFQIFIRELYLNETIDGNKALMAVGLKGGIGPLVGVSIISMICLKTEF